MRNFKSFLFYTACISMLVFASCKKDNGKDPKDPEDSAGKIQADKLAGTWTPDFNTNDEAITYNGLPRAADFGSFRLTIEAGESATNGIWGGSYTASGQPDGEGQVIWPASGTWKFPSAKETGSMVRNDGVDISISSVTDETLVLKFTVPDPDATSSARVAGFFSAEWSFTLSK